MTPSRRLLAAAPAGVLALVVAAVAFAEPARKADVSSAAPKFTWEATGSGSLALTDIYGAVGCAPGIHDCDDTLLHVTEPGTLSVKIGQASATLADADLHVFASDESGKEGKVLKESAGNTPDESTSLEVDPGYFLVRIDFAIGQGTVKGEANFAGGAPLDPGAAVTTTPAPANQAPVTSAKAPKGKVKSFSGTAKDADGSVASVAIGVLKLENNGKCKQLKNAGGAFASLKKCTEPTTFLKAKGTTSWSFALKKALKKGSYVLFAKATDDKGLAESGFGPANKKAFKVK